MKIETIISIIIASLFYSCNGGDKEVIIVPKNYRGYIVIIYNQKSGEKIKYEDRKRIYEIPSTGILKTQFEANYGLREFTEYYFDKIGDSSKIPSYANFKTIPSNIVVGFIGASGNANKDYEGKKTVEYSLYYIGTKDEIIKAVQQAEKLDIASIGD